MDKTEYNGDYMGLLNRKPTRKNGDEKFVCENETLPYNLQDLWCWCSSDLLTHSMRGILAEFITATALNVEINEPRDPWSSYDLVTPEGVKVEVKSGSYIQYWNQKKLTRIVFSIRKTNRFDNQGYLVNEPARRRADVYVFCILANKDELTLNPLDLSQWEFYTVSSKLLDAAFSNQKTISFKRLQTVCSDKLRYDEVRKQVLVDAEYGVV